MAWMALRWVVYTYTSLHLLEYIFWVTNTLSIFKDGYFYSYSSTFLEKKTVLLIRYCLATLLSLLCLNAIQVKTASVYSKRAIYFSLVNERSQFANESFF